MANGNVRYVSLVTCFLRVRLSRQGSIARDEIAFCVQAWYVMIAHKKNKAKSSTCEVM
jgi:hypothetical protein